jgi:predicted RNase H-like nuclease (RuvC/YqgF family)
MSTAWASAGIGAVSAAFAGAAVLFSARAAGAVGQAQRYSVDAGAYTRAQQIYEESIASMRTDLDRLQAEVLSLRREVSSLRRENARLTAELDELRRSEDGSR